MARWAAAIAGLAVALGPGTAWAQAPANPFDYKRASSFTYKSNGMLETETIEPDNPAACVVTTHVYDAYGNKQQSTTSNCAGASGRAVFASRSTTSTYAQQSVTVNGVPAAIPAGTFATSIANALNQGETRVHDPRFGTVTAITGPNGLTTRFEYDPFGRPVKEIRADGTSVETYHCIIAGRGLNTSSNSAGCGATAPLSGQAAEIPALAVSYVQTVPRDAAGVQMGPAARVYQNREGHTVRELAQGFDGGAQPTSRRYIVKDTKYNDQGAKIPVTEPYFLGASSSTVAGSSDMGMTLTMMDPLGRPIRVDVADAQGNVAGVDFAGLGTRTAARALIRYSGLTVTTTNPKGQTRKEEKNADGKVVRVTDTYGAQVAYQHDAFGNLVKTKDALQNLVLLSHDVRGRKVSMQDPDSGLWSYDYNGLGELVWQQSPNQRAKAQATTMEYDKLGRLVRRVDPEYTSTWYYDAYAGGAACAKGIGKLCESNTSHGVNKKYVFDGLGRPLSSRTTVSGGPSFAAAVSYQPSTGRLWTRTYPTGLKVQQVYTAWGFLGQVQLATTATLTPLPSSPGGPPGASVTLNAGAALWSAGTFNAWGKPESQTLGSGVSTRATYEAASGRPTRLTSGIGSATDVLDHRYTWDSLNNLTARTDANGDGSTGAVNETFSYDDINRLSAYTVSAPSVPNLARTVTLQYNAIGNLLHKSDVGSYTYPPYGSSGEVTKVRPHAVSRIEGGAYGTVSYSYDANGNAISASGGPWRTISYTSFDLPDGNLGIGGLSGGPRLTWQYDENHQRLKETRTSSAGTRTTWFQHPDNQGGLGFESEVGPSGAQSQRHYVSTGGHTLVLVSTAPLPALSATQTAPPAISSIALVKLEHWHRDHLGSLAATTDHAGRLTARYAYDPFGKRRMTNGQYDAAGKLVVDWTSNTNAGTDRGFTGHEHLDELGIVHMNGRIYDPTIARMLQPDPLIQAMDELQSFNRYSYCLNNPLNHTDPSGHSWLSKTWHKIWHNKTFRVVASIAAAWFLGPGGLAWGQFGVLGTAITSPLAQAAIAGFVSGAISSGTLKGAAQGAFTASAFAMAGEVIEIAELEELGSIAVHGVTGCVTSVAGGGRCGDGALSAAFSKAAVVHELTGNDPLTALIISSVVGGTATALGGGKFSNGAQTAAFAYVFNCILHECFAQGRDAEKRWREFLDESGATDEYGLDFNKSSDGDRNYFGGRPDIFSKRLRRVWDVKPASRYGLTSGEIQIAKYKFNSGYEAGAAELFFDGQPAIILRGSMNRYEYLPGPGGLILYKALDPSPATRALAEIIVMLSAVRTRYSPQEERFVPIPPPVVVPIRIR